MIAPLALFAGPASGSALLIAPAVRAVDAIVDLPRELPGGASARDEGAWKDLMGRHWRSTAAQAVGGDTRHQAEAPSRGSASPRGARRHAPPHPASHSEGNKNKKSKVIVTYDHDQIPATTTLVRCAWALSR